MPLFPILLMFLSIFRASGSPKMIIIWGFPMTSGASEVISDWDTCIDKCLEEDTCVFLWRTGQDGCNLYRFGNILTARKLDASYGRKIAMKLEMDSDTCPISPDPPLFGKSSGSYEYSDQENYMLYSTTITSDGSNLNFYFNSTSYCPSGSKLFIRETDPVCLGIRFFKNDTWCGNYTDASALCREPNGISLTGPANSKEYQYFLDESTPPIIMSTGTPKSMKNFKFLIWMDGWCEKEAEVFVFEDHTHYGRKFYNLPDTEPNGGPGFCLYFPYFKDDKYYVDDLECELALGPDYCYRGAACRIQPNF